MPRTRLPQAFYDGFGRGLINRERLEPGGKRIGGFAGAEVHKLPFTENRDAIFRQAWQYGTIGARRDSAMPLGFRLVLAGCALFLSSPSLAQEEEDTEIQTTRPDVVPMIPASLDQDAQELVKGSNAFSLDLLRALGERDGNLVISPASVSAAMGIAYRGALGETAAQLRKVMRYPFDPERNLKASGAAMATMSFSASGRDLRTVNALWLQDGMPFNENFERDVETYAKSGIGRVSFRDDPEAARAQINDWVKGATNKNITELLKEDIVTSGTRAVLVNAIWFKADWRTPFAKEVTRMEPFTAIDGTVSSTPLMHQRGYFPAFKRDGISAIQLPYMGGEVALVAFLPDDHGALPKFEEKLSAQDLAKWFADLDRTRSRDTIVTLPKLKLRWASDLKSLLNEMGAPLAFSDDANFGGMARLPYPGGDPREIGLKISHVIHETNIDLNEAGSEASAATAVVMDVVVTSVRRGPPPPPPFVFKADKPFLFALRDLRTGLLLFVGRYVRPEGASN